jgi:superfamily II RNA helicase
MVKVCSITNYPNENETKYKEHFDKFKYPLHIFQKWAIESIVEGNHVLVTAPTGSGKSLPAEFALDFFYSKGKKTIYCSPIKSLSNQKFYDFSQKYPHISVGLITGDIKTNPDANVLIMTTEILLNKLYQVKSNSTNIQSSVSFEMDIYTELGCVIFDEIHYINDASRGHVWENSIMLLPKHVQMIGLSATLDDPAQFAYWLETKGENVVQENDKIVYLTSKKERAVPLTHYSFITTNQGIFKAIKDKTVHEEIKQITNKPFVIQDSKGKFNEEQYFKMKKMLDLFEKNNIRIKKTHVLNQVTKYLTENEMTPAICYMFSIKQIEMFSKEITTNLLEFDSKIPYTVKRDCDQILREKIPNFEEYFHLPEYINLVTLLEKGIAIHHSKMLPILREIVEIFFEKGYIKLLFATESVAIGLNLPVKTCIFTDINKHDGTSLRMLHGHEYVQAAGRAGRLGLDKVGHVIHLNNLFRNVNSISYKQMMHGKPQTLVSKFKISYNLLLNLIEICDFDFVSFSNKSMITNDLTCQQKEVYNKISSLNCELDNIKLCLNGFKTPINIIKKYIELQEKRLNVVNKQRKDVEKQLQEIIENYKFIENEKKTYQSIIYKENELIPLNNEYNTLEKYIETNVNIVFNILKDNQLIEGDFENKSVIQLTLKGKITGQLKELPCLVFGKVIENKLLDQLSCKQLVCLFSCFTNIKVEDELKDINPQTNDTVLHDVIKEINQIILECQEKEDLNNINSGSDYNIHYDLLNYLNEWCDSSNVDECKLVLQSILKEKEIFLGEFVKALLKINNIANEMEKIAEMIGNINLLSKLKEIQGMTLKYVVTNQSLYI